MSKYYVVIMAGGIGSRFWPKSRVKYPKQFLDILNTGKSLIQLAYDRFVDIVPKENILVVTNDLYADIVKEQLPDLADDQVLCEPARRNTAPCVAYAAEKIADKDPEATMVVAPSDHLIVDTKAFDKTITKALEFASDNDALVTLGMVPTRPDTGYGYIQFHDNNANGDLYRVKTFTEKPTLEIAENFLKSGDFLWNSGIFVWSARSILYAFQKHLPEVYELFREGEGKYNTPEEKAFIEQVYSRCKNISIDYGIMEKADNVFVIPSDFGWSDLGTWESLYQHYDHDYLGNAVAGDNVMITDASNCMVMVPNDKLVVLQGLDKYCVIDTGDVLLVCERSKEQEIKQITADVKKQKGDKFV